MLLRVTARLAPRYINVSIFEGLGELPLFNPDFEANPPVNVVAFYRAVADADALLFASPEYADGVTGTIKNALDWLVAALNPLLQIRGGAEHVTLSAPRSRCHTRNTQNHGSCFQSASISIPLLGAGLDELAMVGTPCIAAAVRGSLLALQQAVESRHVPLATEYPIG
jgi:chromate reductase, NAD(P)H dehydrogenase (quinone)